MNFANKSNSANVITAGNALKYAAKYVEQQRRVWKEMTSEEKSKLIASPKGLKSWAMGICNVSLCAVYWVCFFLSTFFLNFFSRNEMQKRSNNNTGSILYPKHNTLFQT